MTAAVDRQLLFGLVALQIGFINQDQLLAAFQAWTLHRSKSLDDHLVERGDLDDADRAAIDALGARHLTRHGGDGEKSLAAVPAGRSTRESLARLADAEIAMSLGHLGTDSTQANDDLDRTASYSVGTATSDGQRFRVLRPHEKGGLGAVFVALDTELDREVALKQILDHHADDPASRQRFVLEAQVTGGLEHPGIVPVYGLGNYDGGRPFYAMRFIRGESLKTAIDSFHAEPAREKDPGRRSLELRKFLRSFLDICNAIGYAHGRGILHRDIKPSNVIVGKHGETLVVDWGLAKVTGKAEAGSGERTLLPSSASGSSDTLPGSVLGTPAYMSPEQASGDLERLGPRSDVYSLGATLYYLLTGKPPIVGDDIGAVLQAVERGDFRAPREIDSSIDRALEAVCQKAMAKKPEDRYATPRALVDDVERWMADEPVSAWREPFAPRARRWARRHRTAVTAAVVAVLVALVGTGAVLAVQTQSKNALALANGRLTDANEQLRISNAREVAARTRAQARFDLAKKAVEAYYTGASEDVLLKQPELEGLRNRLLRTALDFYRELGADLDSDREAGLDSKARRDLARANFVVAIITSEIGNLSDALAAFRQTLDVRREMARLDPGDLESRIEMSRCLSFVGWMLLQLGRPEESMRHYREGKATIEPIVAERPDDLTARDCLAWSLVGIAELERRNGHADLARTYSQKALEIRKELAESSPGNLEWQRNFAASLQDLGRRASERMRPEEALNLYRRALEVRKKLADGHPEQPSLQGEIAGVYISMAIIYRRQAGRRNEAVRLYGEGLAVYEKLVREHPTVSRFQADLGVQHRNIGLMRAEDGNWGAAIESFRRAKAIDEALVRVNPSSVEYQGQLAETLHSLGYASGRLGRTRQAAEAFQGAREAWERLSRTQPSIPVYREELARAFLGSAIVLESQGRTDESVASNRESVDIVRRLAQEHPSDVRSRIRLYDYLSALAGHLMAAGRPNESRLVLREAVGIREALAQAEPGNRDYEFDVAQGLTSLALSDVEVGETAEALKHLEQAGAIRDRLAAKKPEEVADRARAWEFQFAFGKALEASGEYTGAGRAYERSGDRLEQRRSVLSRDHFLLARVYARRSALAARPDANRAAGSAGDVETFAAKAVEQLRRAWEAHYEWPLRIRTESDFKTLWARPDFQLLIWDVAFPAEPFAPAR
jgi:eukaryotic-like serine/threonine-protein kinase